MAEFSSAQLPGAKILYLFLLMVPMTAVAARITLAQFGHLPVVCGCAASVRPLAAAGIRSSGGILIGRDSFYLMLITHAHFIRWARDEEIEVPAINLRHRPNCACCAPRRNTPGA